MVYLGYMATEDGKCDKEIKRRIGTARTAFESMAKILTSRNISIELRSCTAKCYIWSTLLYGAETWTLRLRLLKCGCVCVCVCGCGVSVSMPCGRCAEISLYCVYRCCIDLPSQTPRTTAAVWYKLLKTNFRALTDQFY